MNSTIRPEFTHARFQWLQRLERERVSTGRGKGPVGCQCMRLGWTQWVYGSVDHNNLGEALTAAGQRVLDTWRQQFG